MRVTGNSITANVVSQLNRLAARQTSLQNQVSSGQRVTAPSDDPAAMARALQLQGISDQNSQYAKNVATLQNRSAVAGDALQALQQIVNRAGEMVIGSSSSFSDDQMKAYLVEVRQMIQRAVHLANATDGNQYVFAGTKTDQPPFTVTTDAEGNVTAVNYQGNDSSAEVEIGQGNALTVTAPGQNSSGSGPRGVFADSRYGADLFNHLIALQNHLAAGNSDAISNSDRLALESDEDNLIYHQANNGVAQAQLETTASNLSASQTTLQKDYANATGADLSSTLVALSQTQNAYQLAVQSSAKLLELQQSLFAALS